MGRQATLFNLPLHLPKSQEDESAIATGVKATETSEAELQKVTPTPYTLNPKPETRNPKPETRNPKP